MKTIITYGVFDLFHEGHRRLLERAAQMGDRLIVGVASDGFAAERGKLCVAESLDQRMESVRGCGLADLIIVEDHFGQKAEDIVRYGADVLVMGDDWLGKFDALRELCEVVYLPRTPDISSSLLRSSRYPFLRIGLIGAGRIAGRFVREAGYVRGVQIPCVYHPHPDDSASLARFLSDHTSIVKRRTLDKLFDETDAVYIASPHETHYAYARAALEAGRHVLCEKPLCLRGEEARDLYTLADRKGLVLMEAVKTAYCPGFQRLIAVARSGFIGEIRDVDCGITRLTPPGCREWTDLTYGGSFTELGTYALLPAVKLLGNRDLTASFRSLTDRNGLDIYTRVELQGRDCMASGKCGMGVKTEGQLIVSGTRGYILAEAPWWKTRNFEIRCEDPDRRKRFSCEFEGDGLRYEIADFLMRVQGYPGRDRALTADESVRMAEIMEEFLTTRRRERV